MLAVRWTLSLLFNIQMYLAMAIIAVVFAPWALFSREGAFAACHSYCRWVIFTARIMLGLKVEVRGTPPTGEVVVAAKHQSFFDILVIFDAIPRGKFIMKRELIY
ncbi:MAG: 1-acyl-sn-glycerol-3-phosphate acyltransferase, partial [Paracoccaceae bacterium]